MALLKREEWQGFVRDVDWSYSYVDDEAVFPEWHSGTGKVPREAWQAWEESYKVSYPEYVATQREKESAAYSTRATPPKCIFVADFQPSSRCSKVDERCSAALTA